MTAILQPSRRLNARRKRQGPPVRRALSGSSPQKNHKPSRCQMVVLGPAWFMV